MSRFIKDAIKRPGRLRRILRLRKGEKVTAAAIDRKLAELRKQGKADRSVVSALVLGRRLVSGDLARRRRLRRRK